MLHLRFDKQPFLTFEERLLHLHFKKQKTKDYLHSIEEEN